MKRSSINALAYWTALHIVFVAMPIAAATVRQVEITSLLMLERQTTAQGSQSTEELKSGAPIERELSGGTTHSYRLSLSAGQYLKVVVEQKGIDVVVKLFAPDGQKIAEIDSPNGTKGPEPISAITEMAGDYRLEVQSLQEKVSVGRYEIKIEERRESTTRDRDRIAGEKALAEAEQLRTQRTGETLRKAIEKLNEAVPLWRKAEDPQGEAITLHRLALIYFEVSNFQQTLDRMNDALVLWRKLGDRQKEGISLGVVGLALDRLGKPREAIDHLNQALELVRIAGDVENEIMALNNTGVIYTKLGETQKAFDYYNQALTLNRTLGNRRVEALTLSHLGALHWQLGDSRKALECYMKALPLNREARDRRGEAMTLRNIGLANDALGNPVQALDYYDQALALHRAVGDRAGQAIALNNIGVVHARIGEFEKALESFGQALPLRREVGERRGEALTLSHIGAIYAQLGQFQKALEYYEQALPLSQAVNDRRGEAATTHRIGSIHYSLGQFQKSIERYNQALVLVSATGDRPQEAAILHSIGLVHQFLGEPHKALDFFKQALSLRRVIEDRLGEANTLTEIGASYLSLGKPNEAFEFLSQALVLQSAAGDRVSQVKTLRNISRAERDRGRLTEALAQAEAAINAIEGVRSRFFNEEIRRTFSVSRQDYYEFYIDLLMQMHRNQPTAGHDLTGFHVSERAKARNLIEILNESHADIRQGVDPALLSSERSLQQKLNVKSERLTRLLGGKHTPEDEALVKKEVDALISALQETKAQIRAKSPRYAALTQPHVLSSKQVQELLDEGTLLLEYALGKERSYLWVVSKTSIKSYQLPKQDEIESAARRVYSLLTAKADAVYPDALSDLSRIILGPAADQLNDRKRLVIVADGALQYIPFAALSRPNVVGSKSTNNKYQPLILEHEVISLPSASVLALQRQELSKRAVAAKRLAVFADPVFEINDQRVVVNQTNQSTSPANANEKDGVELLRSDIERSAEDLSIVNFERLPVSRREADLIAARLPKADLLKALDFEANRARAKSPDLSEYQIVHFATHSLLNDQHAELSGIVLSLVDEKGQAQDGFLRLHEIYNLNLNADLVVLSSCQTALGKDIKGEGLVGLTRGFMYAGAPRVVASVWKVSDTATAQLMKRFYQNMLEKNMRPATALRAAQMSLFREKQWRAPYYWAGFILQGEWR